MTTSNYLRADDSTAGDITYTFIGTPQVGCPYEHKCTDYGRHCGSCKHGRRSYYEPDEPYYPYIPYIPYYPYPYPYYPWSEPYWTCANGDDLTMPTTSHYSVDYWTICANGDATYHASSS